MVLEYALLLAPFIFIGIFGRYLPSMPIINQWPIRCTIYEVRSNGIYKKWDYGRNRKNKDGNMIFDVKKANIQTIPKKFTDAQLGADKQTYISLLQPSKTTLIALDEKIVTKGGEDLDAYLQNVLQEEKTLTLRKFDLERNVQKQMREPDFITKNAPLMVLVFLIIAITIFVAVSADPYVKLTDGAIRATESASRVLEESQKVQETNLLIAEKMERIATTLAGG